MRKIGKLGKRMLTVGVTAAILLSVSAQVFADNETVTETGAENAETTTVDGEVTADFEQIAAESSESDFTYIENSDGTLTITAYTGGENYVVFPAEIDGKAVSTIGSGSYDEYVRYENVVNNNVTYVTVSEGITVINNFAFARSNITGIDLPESLITIRGCAFEGCSRLTSLKIPKNVEDNETFDFCYELKSIEVDSENLYYSSEDGVLFDKNKTILLHYPEAKPDSEYTVPSSVKTINGNAIMNCYYLKNLNIPEGVEYIGFNAFWGMDGLETVTVPSTITTVEGTYFSYMSDLLVICEDSVNPSLIREAKSVLKYTEQNGETAVTGYSGTKQEIKIPDTINGSTVTAISDGCFANTNITSVEIPDTVTEVGSNAFAGCGSLTEVVIPESVLSIRDGAFEGCENLTSIIIPEEAVVDSTAVPDTAAQITYTVTGNGVTIMKIIPPAGREDTSIPENIGSLPVTGVLEGARDKVSSDSHTHNYQNGVCVLCGAVYGQLSGKCGDNAVWTLFDTDDDGYYDKIVISGTGDMWDYYFLIWQDDTRPYFVQTEDAFPDDQSLNYKRNIYIKDIIIEEGITSVGECAFKRFINAESVSLPSTLLRIEHSAFDYTSFKEVNLPDGLQYIGIDAFWGADITEIEIPGSVKNIGADAFLLCHNLKSVIINDGVETIGMYAFTSCNLTEVVLPNTVTTVDKGAFLCSTITQIILPEGLDAADNAFPETAAQIVYKIENGNAVITEIILGSENKEVEIPKTILGKDTELSEDVLENITEIPHVHVGGTASCTLRAVCEICGAEYGEPNGHNFTDYVSDGNATCTVDGTKTAKCDNCEETDTVTDAGSKKEHNFSNGSCLNCGTADPNYTEPVVTETTVTEPTETEPSEIGSSITSSSQSSVTTNSTSTNSSTTSQNRPAAFSYGYTTASQEQLFDAIINAADGDTVTINLTGNT
ncbi:MAG: leucine-rich repeat domain-containing protein, partial [Muribaculaceae bacterium]|nr:leucine-rich repeat domain-containing protein [Muribaculaceae bacterium]